MIQNDEWNESIFDTVMMLPSRGQEAFPRRLKMKQYEGDRIHTEDFFSLKKTLLRAKLEIFIAEVFYTIQACMGR
jgi:hypothetical protein